MARVSRWTSAERRINLTPRSRRERVARVLGLAGAIIESAFIWAIILWPLLMWW